MRQYTHLEMDQDVNSIAGYYTLRKEVRLKYNGREVLYIIGQAVIESSCCGPASWGYAIVPGYIVNWRKRADQAGHQVSEVEPITDEKGQDNIRQIIQKDEAINQIEFW